MTLLGPGDPAPPAGSVVCALVNNMPDAAFARTEDQFLGLLAGGMTGGEVYVKRFTLPGTARGPEIAERIDRSYLPADGLWDSHPAVLVVTGSEPLAPTLPAEAYWRDLVDLLDWAVASCDAVLLSCLAAHVALLHFDGIERRRLTRKCSGVFDSEVNPGHPLSVGLPSRVAVPHSRLNGVDSLLMHAAGYEVVVSGDVGWGVAAARRGRCRLLLFQGHPEYDADTLLREYRRDLIRFANGEAAERPEVPEGYFTAGDAALLEDLAVRSADQRPAAFPFEEIAGRLSAGWAAPMRRLCRNWLDEAALASPLGARS